MNCNRAHHIFCRYYIAHRCNIDLRGHAREPGGKGQLTRDHRRQFRVLGIFHHLECDSRKVVAEKCTLGSLVYSVLVIDDYALVVRRLIDL